MFCFLTEQIYSCEQITAPVFIAGTVHSGERTKGLFSVHTCVKKQHGHQSAKIKLNLMTAKQEFPTHAQYEQLYLIQWEQFSTVADTCLAARKCEQTLSHLVHGSLGHNLAILTESYSLL